MLATVGGDVPAPVFPATQKAEEGGSCDPRSLRMCKLMKTHLRERGSPENQGGKKGHFMRNPEGSDWQNHLSTGPSPPLCPEAPAM